MGSENRVRSKQVPIRLSTNEYENVKKKADKVNKSVPSFLRELALNQKVSSPIIDHEGALEIAKQIRMIGNNLNQLTRLAHQNAKVINLVDTKEELHRLWQQLCLVRQSKQTD